MPTKMVSAFCKNCGKSFKYSPRNVHGKQIYCSHECSNNGSRKEIKYLSCAICGKPFPITGDKIGGSTKKQKTCSRACGRFYKTRIWTPKNIELLRRFYPTMGSKRCADLIGTSPQYVRWKAHKLGIRIYASTRRELFLRSPAHFKLIDRISNGLNGTGLPSKLELKFKSALTGMNLIFVHQYEFNKRFVVDFAFMKQHLVVQIDGCYWHGHGCDGKVISSSKLKRKQIDNAQDQYIKTLGWAIIRFWECDLNRNMKGCLDLLLGKL